MKPLKGNMRSVFPKRRSKCGKCDKLCATLNGLKNHMKELCVGTFQCVERRKNFKEESQLTEHAKKYLKFPFDDCDNVNHFEGTLEGHKSAGHEEF